jgi:hypothetical protein
MESLPAWCLEELAELLWSSSRWPWLLASRVSNLSSICFVRWCNSAQNSLNDMTDMVGLVRNRNVALIPSCYGPP